jgi:hypothetical protein
MKKCKVCKGRGWLVVAVDGDPEQLRVESCDGCQDTKDKERDDAAEQTALRLLNSLLKGKTRIHVVASVVSGVTEDVSVFLDPKKASRKAARVRREHNENEDACSIWECPLEG